MAKQSIVDSMNEIRRTASEDYQSSIPQLDETSSIDALSAPILEVPKLMNEFTDALVQRIVYTKFLVKKEFKSPLKFLEGDEMPLGYIGQEIFINPAKGRNYDVNDFAGLLKKYEADIKVQYPTINFDKQYCVSVGRSRLKQAFVSWESFEAYIGELTNSLYRGAYFDEYNYTKQLISDAYRTNSVQIQTINYSNSKETAAEFLTQVRNNFLNFNTPSSDFNAWKKVGGYGREIITTCPPEDVVLIVRNDILSYIDVNYLSGIYNLDKAELSGRVIGVKDFNIYDDEHNVVFDGKNILALQADKSWFRIKTQDIFMNDFRNPNNRTANYYLNLTKMFQYSFFANAIVYATEEPKITITNLDFKTAEGITLEQVGDEKELDLTVTPNTANSPEITFTTSDENVFVVDKDGQRHCKITAIGKGTATLTATAGTITATVNVTVK